MKKNTVVVLLILIVSMSAGCAPAYTKAKSPKQYAGKLQDNIDRNTIELATWLPVIHAVDSRVLPLKAYNMDSDTTNWQRWKAHLKELRSQD